jgi:protein tyrosine/serine phosphatase
VLTALWLDGCTTAPLPASERPASWAQPIAHEGLPNFCQVSDSLYRGAQPTSEGFQQLAAMKIKTVINARQGDADGDAITTLKMTYVRLPMSAWDANDEDVIRFLRIATDPNATPVFVHCHRGADRTGVLCAMYRVAVQGWSKDDAIAEMTQGGMGYHRIYRNLASYVRDADVARIRREAGIVP